MVRQTTQKQKSTDTIHRGCTKCFKIYYIILFCDIVFVFLSCLLWTLKSCFYVCCLCQCPRPKGYKTFFMLNSTEHEIYHAHKC